MKSENKFAVRYLSYLQILEEQRGNHIAESKQIHKLRVAIKYLRSIHQLLLLVNGIYRCKKFIGHLKKVFKLAGAIREAQINCLLFAEFTNDFELTEQYRMVQDKRILKGELAYKKALESLSDCNIIALKSAMENLSDTTISNQLMEFIAIRMEKIIQISGDQVKSGCLHEIRKQLKAIKAIREFSKDQDSDFFKLLVQTEELIGEWHDRDILLNDIKKTIKRKKAKWILRRIKIVMNEQKIIITSSLFNLLACYRIQKNE